MAARDLPFRLQLIGHFGEGGNLSGIFEATDNPSPVLARPGEELAGLGLTVQMLAAEPATDDTPARMVARVWDHRTGRTVELPESVRVRSGIGAALLAPAGYPGEAIELLAGEIVEVGDSEFRVESIRVSPAAVRLRRLAVAVSEDDEEELVLPSDGEGAES